MRIVGQCLFQIPPKVALLILVTEYQKLEIQNLEYSFVNTSYFLVQNDEKLFSTDTSYSKAIPISNMYGIRFLLDTRHVHIQHNMYPRVAGYDGISII